MAEEYKPHFHREIIIDELRKFKWKSLLEVGCGHCDNLKLIKDNFPDAELYGIDNNKAVLDRCFYRTGEVQLADLLDIPYNDKSFDVVLSDATLIYIKPRDINKAFDELIRVAKKRIIISEYHSSFPVMMDNNRSDAKYARDYNNFGEPDKIIKFPEKWNDTYWDKFGHIIIWKL